MTCVYSANMIVITSPNYDFQNLQLNRQVKDHESPLVCINPKEIKIPVFTGFIGFYFMNIEIPVFRKVGNTDHPSWTGYVWNDWSQWQIIFVCFWLSVYAGTGSVVTVQFEGCFIINNVQILEAGNDLIGFGLVSRCGIS